MIKLITIGLLFQSSHGLAVEYSLEDLINLNKQRGIQSEIEKTKVLEIESQIDESKSSYFPEISARIGGERIDSRSESQVNGDNFVAELKLDYNLYSFGKTSDKVNALKSLKSEQIKSVKYSQTKNEIIIKKEFYEALYFKEVLVIFKKELVFNKDLRKQVLKKRNEGLVGNSDVLEVEMRKATLENKILALEEEYKHAKDGIRKLLFIPHEQELKLKGEIHHEHFDAKEHELIEGALLNNRKLALNKARLTSLKYELDSARMNRLPEINIRGRYGKLEVDEKRTQNSVEGAIGIYVDIPIFDGGKKKSAIGLYKARLAQQQLQVNKKTLDLKIDVAHHYEKMMTIHKQVDLGEANVKSSKVYFKNVLNEYKRGVKNSLDLVSARDRLLNFNDDLILYRKNFLIAKAYLEEVTGVSFK